MIMYCDGHTWDMKDSRLVCAHLLQLTSMETK
jgi:hypothetical protein